MAKRPQPAQPQEPINSALADLLRANGFTAAEAPAPAPAAPASGGIDLAKCGKLVVRRERKGRGGKTVTLVSGIDGCPAERDRIARDLRKALGCGATVESQLIVVQGDQVDRIHEWLHAHGARQIARGT